MHLLPTVIIETGGAVAWRQADILVIAQLVIIGQPLIRLIIQVQLHAIDVRERRLPSEMKEGKKG